MEGGAWVCSGSISLLPQMELSPLESTSLPPSWFSFLSFSFVFGYNTVFTSRYDAYQVISENNGP